MNANVKTIRFNMANHSKKVMLYILNNLSNYTHNSRIVIRKKPETETICSQVNVNVSNFNKITTCISKLVKQTQTISKVSKANFKVNHVLLLVPPLIVLTNTRFNSQVLKHSSVLEVPVGFMSKSKNNEHFYNQLLRSKTINCIPTGLDNSTSLIKSIKACLGISSSESPTNNILGKELKQFQSGTKLNKENFSPEVMHKQLISFVEGYWFALEGVILQNSSWKPYWYIGFCIFTVWLVYNAKLTMSTFSPNITHSTTKFNNAKGAEEAKEKMKKYIVEFFKTPDKFTVLSGKLPRGVLLVGLTATGTTLLAKAEMAGEARVPFFYTTCLGSEFDEVCVGAEARRVRELFRRAKVNTPCVIFIDEIGRQRTTSAIAHRRTNDTIYQLLPEKDGLNNRAGMFVLGARNRKVDLDEALMRSGRFDVEVTVLVPDFREVLEFYLGIVKCQHVDIEKLARGTTNFTGADMELSVNQVAGAEHGTTEHLEFTRDSSLLEPESLSNVTDEDTNRITAYHEGGRHHAPLLHKVPIITRGQSLRHSAYIQDRDILPHVTRSQLLMGSRDVTLARRAAEVVFGPDSVTWGASGDQKKATLQATTMMRRWGKSEVVGLVTYSDLFLTSPEVRFS